MVADLETARILVLEHDAPFLPERVSTSILATIYVATFRSFERNRSGEESRSSDSSTKTAATAWSPMPIDG